MNAILVPFLPLRVHILSMKHYTFICGVICFLFMKVLNKDKCDCLSQFKIAARIISFWKKNMHAVKKRGDIVWTAILNGT